MPAPHERLTDREQHDLAMHLAGVVLHRKTGLNLAGPPLVDLRRAREIFVESRWESALPALDAEIARVSKWRAEQDERDESQRAGRLLDAKWIYQWLGDEWVERFHGLRQGPFIGADGSLFFAYYWLSNEPGPWPSMGSDIYRNLVRRQLSSPNPEQFRLQASFVWSHLSEKDKAVIRADADRAMAAVEAVL